MVSDSVHMINQRSHCVYYVCLLLCIGGAGYTAFKVLPEALHVYVDNLELTSPQGIFKVIRNCICWGQWTLITVLHFGPIYVHCTCGVKLH